MPTLTELHEQRGRLVTAARERLDQINANTDETRAAELESQHDAAMAEYDAVVAKIDREERVAALERDETERRERALRDRRPTDRVDTQRSDTGDSEVTYRSAFMAYVRAEGQLGMLDAEQRSVLQRGYQLIDGKETRAQTTAAPAAGGYMVPVELQAEIIKTMKAWGPMYDPGVTREITTGGGYQMTYPTVDDTGNTSTATTQGQTLADDGSGDAVIGQKTLGAYSFGTPWLRVSKELADDAMSNVEAFLGDLLGERLGRGANYKLTVGSGANEPNGIVTAAGVGVTAASATAFTFDDVISLEHSIDPAYRQSPRAAYMMNDLILQIIRKLKDGQGNYLWQHGDVKQGVPATLNGRNYIVNQAMASTTVANAKVLLFGDLNKYFVRKVGAPLIGALQDKDFWPGFGMAGFIRFDGNLMDASAVKTLKLAGA